MKVQFSWRYGVVGVYRDHDRKAWIVYPVPFVRIVHDPQNWLRG